MDLHLVTIEKPDDVNIILGQSHFIKTVEDIHEAMVGTVPGVAFGVAFCESSGPCLVRYSGTDDELIALAQTNALALAAGHVFIVLMRNAFPVNVLNTIKRVPEVCTVFCASANPVQVVVAQSEQGRGVLGVIDGSSPKGMESEQDRQQRHQFLRTIGYKL